MLERTINYVNLPHLGRNSKKKISEEIEYGEFFPSVAFPHEMRYRFETWGNEIKGNKEGLYGPKYL